MGVTVTLPITNTSANAALDILEYLTASTRGVRVKRVYLTSDSTASQKLRLTFSRVTGAPTSGSGGSTTTPVVDGPLVGSVGGTAEIFNTTRISGGTKVDARLAWWNKPEEFNYVPIEDKHVFELEGGTRFVIGLETAPSPAANITGFVELEVIG